MKDDLFFFLQVDLLRIGFSEINEVLNFYIQSHNQPKHGIQSWWLSLLMLNKHFLYLFSRINSFYITCIESEDFSHKGGNRRWLIQTVTPYAFMKLPMVEILLI